MNRESLALGVKERRRYPRTLQVGTKAALLAPDHPTATFSVEDISASGARIVGRLPLAIATPVKIMFNVEGFPITLAAEVVRVVARDDSTFELAVEFCNMSSAIRDKIQSFVLQANARDSAASSPAPEWKPEQG